MKNNNINAFAISMNKENGVLTVTLEGRLDKITSVTAEKMIAEEMQEQSELVLDLVKLEYISSAGIRMLVSLHKQFRDRRMTIINVRPTIREILTLGNLTNYLL